ncbi:type II toxin-antitoxin system HicB family antitoxin [Candidatus Woesearchaeota archaeon]|nr:type II toxin-antitoxin system HicB family antitoxin [Candidatus Woesearchaeota archaeon]
MEYRLSAVVFREGKFYVARGVEVELASQGKTVEEALKNLKEAFELWVKHAEHDELEVFKDADSPIVTQVVAA